MHYEETYLGHFEFGRISHLCDYCLSHVTMITTLRWFNPLTLPLKGYRLNITHTQV